MSKVAKDGPRWYFAQIGVDRYGEAQRTKEKLGRKEEQIRRFLAESARNRENGRNDHHASL